MSSRVLAFTFSLLAIAAVGCGNADAHETPHWSYKGATGPDHWFELDSRWAIAKTGTHQSPIDITNPDNTPGPHLELRYAPTPLVITNNGHTIEVECEKGSTITMDGERYELLQFHFHGPSEHTIAGKHAPLEAHFVHKSAQGHLAVIGVLLDEGPANAELATIWAHMPANEGPPHAIAGTEIDPAALLPSDRASFLYDGSLTTPPCTEGVHWLVMRSHVRASKAQIAAFHELIGDNNRPTQPLCGRKVRVAN